MIFDTSETFQETRKGRGNKLSSINNVEITEKGQKYRIDSYGDLKKKVKCVHLNFFSCCRLLYKKGTNGYRIHKNVKNLRYICRIKRV